MADLTSLFNYLVPAAGTVHGYPVEGTFSATPTEIDFRFIELDGDVFTPSGVFIDNTAGTGDLTITIKGVGPTQGYVIICPAGGRLQTQYPAPLDQQISITGLGDALLVFVDFPVIPFIYAPGAAGTAVSIANGADVALGATDDAAATSPFADFSLIALQKYADAQLLSLKTSTVGVNSIGGALPDNFNWLPQTMTYAGGILQTIAKTNGVNTWTQTYTYTGADLTGISAWVQS